MNEVYAALAGSILHQGPSEPIFPTSFPIAFSVDFVTNVTTSSTAAAHMLKHYTNGIDYDEEYYEEKDDDDDEDDNEEEEEIVLGGTWYYDWSQQSQRIDYSAGSYECIHFYQTTAPCSLYFLPTGGMYRVIHHDSSPFHYYEDDEEDDEEEEEGKDSDYYYDFHEDDKTDCCLDLPHVGIPSPNWASMNTALKERPNVTYEGIVMDQYSQLLAHQWSFPIPHNDHHLTSSSSSSSSSSPALSSIYNFHTIREVAFGPYKSIPLGYSFRPTGDDGDGSDDSDGTTKLGLQDFYLLVETYDVGPQEKSIFELPKDCLNRPPCQQQQQHSTPNDVDSYLLY